MKPANLHKSPVVHDNIIIFPGSPAGVAGLEPVSLREAPHLSPIEIPISRPEIHVYRDPENIRDLFAATRDILARRYDPGDLTKIRQLHFSRRIPRGIRIPQVTAPSPFHGNMKRPTAESRMKMLFDLKRDEKPPVNFLRDFLTEFQRRNYGSGVRPQPSPPKVRDTPTG